jgi:hypothetical protein
MEILWMRMDEKGQKNITKVDPPQFYKGEWMKKGRNHDSLHHDTRFS